MLSYILHIQILSVNGKSDGDSDNVSSSSLSGVVNDDSITTKNSDDSSTPARTSIVVDVTPKPVPVSQTSPTTPSQVVSYKLYNSLLSYSLHCMFTSVIIYYS